MAGFFSMIYFPDLSIIGLAFLFDLAQLNERKIDH
jgi:hypothetical protein